MPEHASGAHRKLARLVGREEGKKERKKKKEEEGKKKRKEKEQVIQGSHMVSGTRCPAWSD